MMDPFSMTKIQKMRSTKKKMSAALKPPRYILLAKTSRGSLEEKGKGVLVIFVTTLLIIIGILSTIRDHIRVKNLTNAVFAPTVPTRCPP